MKSPVIRTPRKSSGYGAYAHYFVLDKNKTVGVKVLKRSISIQMIANRYKSFLNEVKERDWFVNEDEQSLFAAASAEYVALQMLAGTGNTPIPFGLCWVKGKTNRYRIGIVMEHIQGKTLEDWCDHQGDKSPCTESERCEHQYQNAWFKNFDVTPVDWHSQNIMVDNKNVYHRIDLSVGYFTLSKEYIRGFTRQCIKEIKELIENAPNEVASRSYPW